MLYLDSITPRHPAHKAGSAYPFSVPALASLDQLAFKTPITFLAGENGSGKSTLLEGLAAGMNAYAIGAHGQVISDPYLPHAKTVAHAFYFGRKRHARVRMFLRAEDVLGYIRRQNEERLDETLYWREKARIKGEEVPPGDAGLIDHIIQSNEFDTRSHGEGFLDILSQRLHGAGLYFLDEPESPLSPESQLQLAHLLRRAADDGAQLIIATHSPVLLAIPEATILHFGPDGVHELLYEELHSIQLLKRFLDNPRKYLDGD